MRIDWKTLFITPKGRIGRTAFWAGFVIVMVASLVVGMLGMAGKILGFVLIWPQIAIHAKRLHDMHRTAWLMLIPFAVTVLSFILAAMVGGPALMVAMSNNDNAAMASMASEARHVLLIVLAPFLTAIGFLLWVGLTKGDDGPNKFGEAPPSAPLDGLKV